MKVAFVASEAVPYAKTGGLADVIGALPPSLRGLDIETTIIMPRYRSIAGGKKDGIRLKVAGAYPVSAIEQDGSIFIDHPGFFDRDGLYGDNNGDYPDNCERFVHFCKAAMQVVEQKHYDIVHCHDWQSGLVPLYARIKGSKTKSVFTIHNLGYQGKFDRSKFPLLGIDKKYFTPEGLEFYGDMNFLKAGIVYADGVTTVSENYAREIQTPELGFGLDGVLRARRRDLHGIINGIDYREWDPGVDGLLYETYQDFDGKQRNKLRLCEEHGLDAQQPLIGIVSRIAGQKGFDILVKAMADIMKLGCNMIILGFGEEAYHVKLSRFAKDRPCRLSVHLKFDNTLAHRIYAGSDFFLMPSLYEPCGLGQLISLRYGTVPIVRKTGGLADTVFEFDAASMSGNGFLFTPYNSEALVDAAARACRVYADPAKFKELSDNCRGYDYSWSRSAKKYGDMYERLLRH
ncbi:glycogen synthase GlgA [candidate division WOR-3 bacterium]|nr:glycogen synthase GlgA [candidate division WOR-3 bacterium]